MDRSTCVCEYIFAREYEHVVTHTAVGVICEVTTPVEPFFAACRVFRVAMDTTKIDQMKVYRAYIKISD